MSRTPKAEMTLADTLAMALVLTRRLQRIGQGIALVDNSHDDLKRILARARRHGWLSTPTILRALGRHTFNGHTLDVLAKVFRYQTTEEMLEEIYRARPHATWAITHARARIIQEER